MLRRTARPFTEEIDEFPYRAALMAPNYGLPRGASKEEREFKRMFSIDMIVHISLSSRFYYAGRRSELHELDTEHLQQLRKTALKGKLNSPQNLTAPQRFYEKRKRDEFEHIVATGQKKHEEAEWTMLGANEAVGLRDRQVRELAWSQWCTNMDGSDDLLPDDAPFKYFLKDKWLEDSVALARASAPGIIQ